MVVDTAAPTYVMRGYQKALEDCEKYKFAKHGTRVEVAEGGNFLPMVVSVYGTLAPGSQKFIRQCTEHITGPEGPRAKGFSRLLHLQRARMQAAIANAVNLSLWGRTGTKARKEEKGARRLKEKAAEERMPVGCVLADAAGEVY